MQTLKFHPQFLSAILSKRKCHTIRRDTSVTTGDWLNCESADEDNQYVSVYVQCRYTQPIVISEHGALVIDGVDLDPSDIKSVIYSEGFDSEQDFIRFFKATYGLPFQGVLIHWHTPVHLHAVEDSHVALPLP
ncbi:MAG: hypothetical protein ACPG4U_10110 [Pseudomonadales bacterium]